MCQHGSLTQPLKHYIDYGYCRWREANKWFSRYAHFGVTPDKGLTDKHPLQHNPLPGASLSGCRALIPGARTVNFSGGRCALQTDWSHTIDLNSPTGSGPDSVGTFCCGPLIRCPP